MVFAFAALFMMVGVCLMLFVARREDFVFYCKQEKIIEYYECDFRIEERQMVVYTRRFARSLEIIKKCYNEDLKKNKKDYNSRTYAYAKSYH